MKPETSKQKDSQGTLLGNYLDEILKRYSNDMQVQMLLPTISAMMGELMQVRKLYKNALEKNEKLLRIISEKGLF